MSKRYVATCQRPTLVTHALKCQFSSPNDLNLIVAGCTRLELYKIGPSGLSTLLDTGVYGQIAVMEKLRLPGHATDAIFIVTESYQYFVLTYAAGKFMTYAKGVVKRVGRPAENGIIGFVDPNSRMIGLHLFEGSLKIIPISNSGTFHEAFDVKVHELMIVSITFLAGCAKPTLAILYQEGDYRHVNTYVVDIKEKELSNGPWSEAAVEMASNLIVPLPNPIYGALVVGETAICFKNETTTYRMPLVRGTSVCHCMIDYKRLLIGRLQDGYGSLCILFVEQSGSNVVIKMESLGRVNIPSAISYLDDGVVFLGSKFGDAQLLKLKGEPVSNGSFVEVLDTYSNIGPILDMCVLNANQGQSQLVTCSGAYGNGSLRVITSGIGISALAELEMPGVQGLWSIRGESDHDSILALSLVGQTVFLSVQGEELESIEINGASKEETLYCGNMCDGNWIQVVRSGVYLINSSSLACIAKWEPTDGNSISSCSCTTTQLVLAAGAQLMYFRISADGIKETGSCILEHEIACLHIASIDDSVDAKYCVTGLWNDFSVRIIRLDGVVEVYKELIGGNIIPRSVLLTNFGKSSYTFCALGDGSLLSFTIDKDTGKLESSKRVRLASQAIALHIFEHDGKINVFAASDRPSIIHLSNGKLLFSSACLPAIRQMCTLHTTQFPHCLVLATSEGLKIGTIDDIQELQIRTIGLDDAPYRICNQPSSAMLAVIAHSDFKPSPTSITSIGWVHLFSNSSMMKVDSFGLDAIELPMSIISMTLPDGTDVFCIGTCVMVETEDEPKKGRILTFKVVNGKLHKIHAMEVRGAVYTLGEMKPGKLIAGINSEIQLFAWAEESFKLECGHHGHVLVLNLRSHNDLILVGDLMRSCTLLRYGDQKLEEVAMDSNNNFWVMDVSILDPTSFMFADNMSNLLVCKHDPQATNQNEQMNLTIAGEVHVGSMVLCIRKGTLSLMSDAVKNHLSESTLFGTQSGSIGVVIPIDDELYGVFQKVCVRLAKVLACVGDLSHASWRALKSDKRSPTEMLNFVDGDLIETFLDLPSHQMEKVVSGLFVRGESNDQVPLTPQILISYLENLGRLH